MPSYKNVKVEIGNKLTEWTPAPEDIGYTPEKDYFVTNINVEVAVAKINYDMSGISFDDVTVSYNGEAHNVVINGDLPDGISVEYYGNGQITPGEYTITARFVVSDPDNYNRPPDMNATLTITSISNNEAPLDTNALNAWIHNGMLHITGLIVGETLSVYAITGDLVYHSLVASDVIDIQLPVQGLYIIKTDSKTIRVVFVQ